VSSIRIPLIFLALLLPACGDPTTERGAPPRPPAEGPRQPIPEYGYKVLNAYPHDPKAFTQGLVFENGFLYESTGLEGESSLRKVELKTGRVVQRFDLDRHLFAEGMTIWKDEIVQLTYKTEIGFVYDKASFKERRRFRYPGEGWGLTHNGEHLIMSNGSAELWFLDPKTYEIVRRLVVKANGQPVQDLNELEWVEGEVYANIWYKDIIARIDPRSGQVVGWINLAGLYPGDRVRPEDHVLNGIAYDAEGKRLFVTGKNWPRLFEIRVVPK
jgi:glutaminyl-peptide cyclotransferase